MNYNLDDDDDEEDAFLHAIQQENNKEKEKKNKDAIGANVNKFAQDVDNASYDASASPYARGGIVEKMIKDHAGLTQKDENLGDDFLETPWRVPDLEQAAEYAAAQVYRGGTAVRSIALTDDRVLPVGVRLYFHLVKSLGVALSLMAAFSLPLLFFAYSGSSMPLEEQDAAGLYQFTLGNVGDLSPHVCSSQRMWLSPSVNETCITAQGVEFSASEVSFVVTLCEFLQCLVLLIVIWHLRRRVYEFSQQSKAREHVSITQYAVYVTGLPPQVTEREIVEHFSSLYQLQKSDWRGRPPVEDARAVQRCDNTGRDVHIGSWVAECTIYRRIGHYLTQYKDKTDELRELYRSRAKMKMYARDTSHAHGADAKRYKRAEREMVRHAVAVDAFTQRIARDAAQEVRRERERRKREREREKQRAREREKEIVKEREDDAQAAVLAVSAAVAQSRENSKRSLSLSESDAREKERECAEKMTDDAAQTKTEKGVFARFFSLFSRSSANANAPAATESDAAPAVVPLSEKDKKKSSKNAFSISSLSLRDVEQGPFSPPLSPSPSAALSLLLSPSAARAESEKDDKSQTKTENRTKNDMEGVQSEEEKPALSDRQTPPIPATTEEEDEHPLGSVVDAAEVVGCFVVFEYNESLARCLEDHALHSALPLSLSWLVCPSRLRLKNHALRVTRAAAPEQILFENLEISETRRFLLKTRTALVIVSLVIVSFLLLLAASLSKSVFAREIPAASLCEQALPALYAGVERHSDSEYVAAMQIVRPPATHSLSLSQNDSSTQLALSLSQFLTDTLWREDVLYDGVEWDGTHHTQSLSVSLSAATATATETQTERERLDAQCALRTPHSFFAYYAIHGNTSRPAANYSLSACESVVTDNSTLSLSHNESAAHCPLYTQSAFCPCVSLSLPESCSSLSCQLSLSERGEALTARRSAATAQCAARGGHYAARAVAQCYCKRRLRALLSLSNLASFSLAFFRSGLSPPSLTETAHSLGGGEDAIFCGTFQGKYLTSYIYSYAAVVITVIVNRVLKATLVYLTKHEKHVSLEQEQQSILRKLFFSTYINMAVIVLIAFAVKIDPSPSADAAGNFFGLSLPVSLPFSVSLGVYTDFTRAWFGNIGFYLVATFCLTAFVPPIESWVKFRVLRPAWKRLLHKYAV